MSVNSSNCCYVVARKMAWIYTVICLLSLACPHHSGQRKDMVKLNFPIVVLKGCPVMLIWTRTRITGARHALRCRDLPAAGNWPSTGLRSGRRHYPGVNGSQWWYGRWCNLAVSKSVTAYAVWVQSSNFKFVVCTSVPVVFQFSCSD